MKLSKRLQLIADVISKYKQGSVLADIGSDHGYLPCYLVKNKIITCAYACDVAQGPLDSAKETIKQYGLEDKVFALLGNGLNPILDREVDMISIAGMGSYLISEILEEHREYLRNVKLMFLQANANNDQDDFALRSVTGSFGIASIPLLASNPKQLEEYANQALYQAKRRGKNQVVIYNEETKSSMQTQKDSKDKENIYSEYAEMIYALTATIDTKDHYTFTHSKNVAYYACELAYAIGLKEDVVEIIREAALLHDIGKIGIREDILNKQGKLTSEEYEIMKGHVGKLYWHYSLFTIT